MNAKWLKIKNDKRADMGVGTMIIFIAMVLVAAVAASVLISTANSVREQAQSTGEQAIRNVASGFVTQDVVGRISTDSLNVQEVYIYMRLSAGSPAISERSPHARIRCDR
jgi:flagellin FlaB